MPQSLSAVYGHLIFSTKERGPFFRDAAKRAELHAYLGGISKQLDCAPIMVGGVEDHVHLLGRIGRTITHAHWVKELKRVSSIWLKQQGPGYADFRWQAGYGLFSVSQSGKGVYCETGRASSEADLSGRIPVGFTTAPRRMGRTIHMGLTRHNPFRVIHLCFIVT